MVNDNDLWKDIKMGDEKAFSTLFYRYSSHIYKKAFLYIRDQEVCEQIVHDIFLSIWTNRKTLQINSFKGYLTSAARYQVYKQLASNKRSSVDYEENLDNFSNTLVSNTGYDRLVSKDLESELEGYLQDLPKRCREIFLLSRKHALSNDEIAERLSISKRSVENQITHALKHLRLQLKDISVLITLIEGVKYFQ